MDWTTILVPERAAFAYSRAPFFCEPSRARKQLSSTTMELSTIIPTPRTRPLMVITFKENPKRVMRIRVIRMEVGMELPTIREALKSPKNRNRTTIDKTIPRISVCPTDQMDSTILSLAS